MVARVRFVKETGTHLRTHFAKMMLANHHPDDPTSRTCDRTGHGTLVPEKYNTQVIPWTPLSYSPKTSAAAAWRSSAKVDRAPTNKVSIKTSHNDTDQHACQVSPFYQVYLTVRYPLPDPEIGVVGGTGSGGNESSRHLPRRPSARGHATTTVRGS